MPSWWWENVERTIALAGLTPLEATKAAMREVTGPINTRNALVLCAVFVAGPRSSVD